MSNVDTSLNIAVFVFGVTGIVVAAAGLVSSMLELHGLTLLRLNGARRITATSNVLKDAFMMSVQNIVVVIGVYGILFSNSASDIIFRSVCWLVVSALVTACCVVDRIRRVRQNAIYDENVLTKEKMHMHRRSTD